MGIEENIERVAIALETLCGLQNQMVELNTRIVAVAEWNRSRLAGESRPGPAPDPKPEVPKAAESAPSEREAANPATPAPSYDELKIVLGKKGIPIAKGTKMTTLLKLWAQHKNDPDVPEIPVPSETSGAPDEQAADADIFNDAPAADEPAPAPMTMEEARAILTKEFTSSDADRAILRAALSEAGVAKFSEVENYDLLVKIARRLKAEAGR